MGPTVVQTTDDSTRLSPAAIDSLPEGILALLGPLLSTFEPRRRRLLQHRHETLEAAHAGLPPTFLPRSEASESSWRVEVPAWALDQRNQITGPADNAKIVVAMCNSADPGCMPDGEDSITTDWNRVRAAHQNTVEAIRGELNWTDPVTGKVHEIARSRQVVFYRPRGLHLSESHAIAGRTISASILNLAVVFFQTAAERRAAARDSAASRRLCFYLPKVESAEEAGWWSNLIAAMEGAIGVPVGTTKVMFLIESLPAAYQIEEILFAASRHAIGMNLGRWDYMASLTHYKLGDPGWILPDRNTIPHDIPFFQTLRTRLVDICHRRGALAIGGMTALFPDRKDTVLNERALTRLAADKRNEAVAGFDGAWTGHPDQHQIAIAQFPAPNQLDVTHPDAAARPDLTPSPAGVGHVSMAGTRDAVRTVIEYRYGVLSGLGARLIKGYDHDGNLIGGFMEDLATDRIYRLMIAQRIRHGVVTEEGGAVTEQAVAGLFAQELETILDEHRAEEQFEEIQKRYRQAAAASLAMIRTGEF